ncbi:MAG: hypothetical protein ACKO37_09855 [Vampirovibrionales bacterium]
MTHAAFFKEKFPHVLSQGFATLNAGCIVRVLYAIGVVSILRLSLTVCGVLEWLIHSTSESF